MRIPALASLALAALMVLSACTATDAERNAPPILPVTTPPVPERPTAENFTPVVAEVLAPPLVVPATDGLTHLAYELVLSNVLGQSVAIESVTVHGNADAGVNDEILLQLSGDALTPWMRPLGASAAGRVLAPGQQAIVTLDVTVDSLAAVPEFLSHEIELSPEAAMPPIVQKPMTESVAVTAVSASTPIVIGSPVRGRGWFDANGCCAVTPHRGAINPINGSLHAPERFAIDFVQLDADGRIFNGEIDDIGSYAFYGADIVAVGDGPIVSMEWNLPEEPPGANPTGLALSEYGGNHIVQDLGDGNYAFYAHLQGGNPEKLRAGQQLSRGQRIGALGNSGNSDMPHLHFHVMDSPLPLASNGLPFLIDSFTLAGTVTSDNISACSTASVSCKATSSARRAITAESPLYGDVIDVRD